MNSFRRKGKALTNEVAKEIIERHLQLTIYVLNSLYVCMANTILV